MKPIKFKEQNLVISENQTQYLPLPVLSKNNQEGEVICCWNLSLKERIKLLLTGKLWVSFLTFKRPLQPSYFTVNKEELI